MGFLIDTCIWVDVERGGISPTDVQYFTKNEPVYISPVTIPELTFGHEMSKNKSIRNKRMAAINRLRKKPLLIIDEVTGDIFGKLASGLYKNKKQFKYRVQDIWIASQALQHGYKLLSRNVKDFADIPGLQLVKYSIPE